MGSYLQVPSPTSPFPHVPFDKQFSELSMVFSSALMQSGRRSYFAVFFRSAGLHISAAVILHWLKPSYTAFALGSEHIL
jgi:hypothetical protein